MRDLTDRPWGVNIAQLFIRDLSTVDFVVDHGVRFVTTSAGDPAVLVPPLKAAGITVFHVVPTLRGALKAIAAGVDGLVVEGIEGGGFKNADGASSMVLVPLIAAQVDVPIVAAGGVSDGISMAAALALGAEGVQMGTRMLTAAESPVHENWKQAVVAAAETDTVVVNRYAKPSMRTLRTELSAAAERAEHRPRWPSTGCWTSTSAADERRVRDERPGRGADRRGAAGAPDPRGDLVRLPGPAPRARCPRRRLRPSGVSLR